MLRKIIEKTMDDILVLYHDKKMSEIEVLETLNKAIYYNSWYKHWVWELFFIQALKNNVVPNNITFVIQLFCNEEMEAFIYPDKIDRYNMQKAMEDDKYFEDVVFKGTRLKVLEHLKLDEARELYKGWLCGQGRIAQVKKCLLRGGK